MPEIINLRKLMPLYQWDVRVDRSSILGNPFNMSKVSTRDVVCDKYRKYFAEVMLSDSNHAIAFQKEMNRLLALYKKHGKLRLFCWCAPKRCHAETIKAWIQIYTS